MGFEYKTIFYGEGFIKGWELVSMMQTRGEKYDYCYLAVFKREKRYAIS